MSVVRRRRLTRSIAARARVNEISKNDRRYIFIQKRNKISVNRFFLLLLLIKSIYNELSVSITAAQSALENRTFFVFLSFPLVILVTRALSAI